MSYRNRVKPDEGGELLSWDKLKHMAKERKLEEVEAPQVAGQGVRDRMYTPDKVKKSDDWDRVPKAKAKTGYFDDSSDEGAGGPPAASRRRGRKNRVSPQKTSTRRSPRHSGAGLEPGVSNMPPLEASVHHRKTAAARRGGRDSPSHNLGGSNRGGGTTIDSHWQDEQSDVGEMTVLQRSLAAAVADATLANNVRGFEGRLEASGATAKLREQTNTEIKEEALQRSIYHIDVVSNPAMRRKDRTIWQPPTMDGAARLENLVKPRMKDKDTDTMWPYPLYKTLTGRMCFVTGLGARCAHVDPCCEGTGSELDRFGLQVSRYFKYTKFFMWFSVVMAVASLPLFFAYAEGGLNPSDPARGDRPATVGNLVDHKRALAVYSLGNLRMPDNETVYVTPLIVGGLWAEELTPHQFFTYVVVGAIIVFLSMVVAAVYLVLMEKDLSSRATINAPGTVSIDEFSVVVKSLPKNVTRDDVVELFERLTAERVVDVAFGEDHEDLIRMLNQRTSLRKDIDLLEGKIGAIGEGRRLVSKATKRAAEAKDGDEDLSAKSRAHAVQVDLMHTERLQKKRIMLIQRLNALLHRMEGRHFAKEQVKRPAFTDNPDDVQLPTFGLFKAKPPLVAYVTFDTRVGKHLAMRKYPTGLLYWCIMPKPRRLLGTRIRVASAPPPDSIIWENIGYSRVSRGVRTALTTVAGLVPVVVTLVVVLLGRRTEWSGFTHGDLDDSLTPGDLSAKLCPDVDPVPGLAAAVPAVLTALNDTELLPSVHCMCTWDSPAASTAAAAATLSSSCDGWWMASVIQLVTPAVVVLNNCLIGWLLRVQAPFDKHRSTNAITASIFGRAFTLQLLNTVGAVVLGNANFEELLGEAPNTYGRGRRDFDWAWFRDVGTDYVVILVLSGAIPCVLSALAACYRGAKHFTRRKLCCIYTSQTDMDLDYTPPHFDLAERFAYMNTLVWTTLLFAAGVPALLWAAAVAFALLYTRDKIVFLRVTRRPAILTTPLGELVTQSLLWAIAAYGLVAVWMMGNDEFVFLNPGAIWIDLKGRDEKDTSGSEYLGRSERDIAERLLANPVNRLLAVVIVYFVTILVVKTGKLLLALLNLVTCGLLSADNTSKDRVRVVMKKDALDATMGSQCWFTKARCRTCWAWTTAKAIGVYHKWRPPPKDRPWASSDDEDEETGAGGAGKRTTTTTTTTKLAATMNKEQLAAEPALLEDEVKREAEEQEAADRANAVDGRMRDDDGFPDEITLTEARAQNRVNGLPSYNIIDNPEYRDGFPFADADLDKVRRLGIKKAAFLKTFMPQRQNPDAHLNRRMKRHTQQQGGGSRRR